MLALGWPQKPGVKIVMGRWQDVLPQLGQFDGIFFDTYSEYYEDLRLSVMPSASVIHAVLGAMPFSSVMLTVFGPLS